jgi:hypothetical protein
MIKPVREKCGEKKGGERLGRKTSREELVCNLFNKAFTVTQIIAYI